MKKHNLKNETCIITFCDIYDVLGDKIGTGYTIKRSDGRLVPVLGDLEGYELRPQILEVRHSNEEKLAIVCWVNQ